MLTWDEIQSNAVAFSKKWKDAKSEDAEAQGFLIDFLRVFGVDTMGVGDFEYKATFDDYIYTYRKRLESYGFSEEDIIQYLLQIYLFYYLDCQSNFQHRAHARYTFYFLLPLNYLWL